MAETKVKSKIAEMGGVLEQGEWKYRHMVMADGTQGEHWSKDPKVFEGHEAIFQSQEDVEYTWVKGAKDKGDKLRIYPPKEGGQKEPYKGPKGKSDYTKGKEAKEDYWERKFNYDVERTGLNDKKLEFQSIRNCLAPFYLHELSVGTYPDADEAINALESKTTAVYNAHNPTAKISDVTK